MKTAIHIDSPPGRPTGIGRYSTELIRALQRRGIPVESWIRWRWRNRALNLPPGIPSRPLLSTRGIGDPFLPALYSFAKGIDVVHSPNGNILPFTGKAKQTVMIHDLAFYIFDDLKPPVETEAWKKKIEKIASRADGILVNSETTADDLEHYFPGSSAKTFISYLGIDHLTGNGQVSSGGKHILAVGTVEPRKNYRKLFKAYRELSLEDPSVPPLVIAGGMGYRSSEIRACATDLNMKDRIRFTGYVSESQLKDLYLSACCLVNPALYEGFGFSVPEALGFGLPVVCSNSSALGELYHNVSFQVDPDDPSSIAEGLLEALRNGMTPSMMSSSQDLFQRLSWSNCAEATEKAFRKIL